MKRVRNPLLLAAFALALIATLVFAGLSLWSAWQWSGRAGRPVAGWMTPRYLVAVYDIDPAALAQVLAFAPDQEPRESLALLARRMGRPIPDVLAEVQSLAEQVRDAE